MPGVGDAPRHHLRRARHVRAGALGRPRRAVQAVFDGDAHQLVVLRQVVDLVDAVAVAVVRAQHRRVLVGQPSPLLRGLAVGERAEVAHLGLGPAGALAVQALEQRREGADVRPISGGTWLVTSCVDGIADSDRT